MRSRLERMRSKIRVRKHIAILLAALIATLLVTNFTEGVSESLIRAMYSKLVGERGTSATEIILDSSGIPIVDYGYKEGTYIGKQRNPVTISHKGLKYYEDYEKGDDGCRQLFLNCADWLVDNLVLHDDYAVLEYRFPWPIYNMTDPWRSGMAQGEAIQVLIRAHDLTNDDIYLDSAEKLLNSFLVEVEDGGVTYKSPEDGWWYEEYADEGGEESRVLNGMMYALLGIHKYYEYSGDSDAKYFFDQGVLALTRSLQDYDLDGYSYYDILGNPAYKYHWVHVRQLNDLYNITNEEIFKEYHDRWKGYGETGNGETGNEQPVVNEPPFIVRLIQSPTKLGVAILVGNFLVLLFALEIVTLAVEKARMGRRGKQG